MSGLKTEHNEKLAHEELVGLLPFYLSGKISSEDRVAVDEWLRDDPDAAFILEKIEAERQATIGVNETFSAPHGGLARLMKDVAQTKQETVLLKSGASFFGSFKKKIFAPLTSAPAGLAWGLCGLLMLITISQSTMLYRGAGTVDGPAGINLARGEKYDFSSRAIVSFADSAEISKVTSLLDSAGAVILDGPTASGHYTIGFVKQEDAALTLEKRYELFKSKADIVALFILQGGE